MAVFGHTYQYGYGSRVTRVFCGEHNNPRAIPTLSFNCWSGPTTVSLWLQPVTLSGYEATYESPELRALVVNCKDWFPLVDWVLEHAETDDQRRLADALQSLL